MKEIYICPLAEVVAFASAAKIAASWNPDWGYEDDVFTESVPEPKMPGDDSTET